VVRNDPVVIGGTGGSGTSVVARSLRTLGLNIGTEGRESEWTPVANFVGRWGPRLVAHDLANQRTDLVRARRDLGLAIAQHEGRLASGPWGWKVPQSCLLLRFLFDCLPDMRYIHVVRDGRDMALSRNQRQAERYGDLLISGKFPEGPRRSARSWSTANCLVLEVGTALLGERFAVARYEDLIERPRDTLAELAHFAGLSPDAQTLAAAASEIAPSPEVGRHGKLSARELRAVSRAAEPGLRAYGYLPARRGPARILKGPTLPGHRPARSGHVVTEAFGVLTPDLGKAAQPAGLVVVGVSRSGTSIATELVASLGLHPPQHDFMGADRHNPTGYWESRALSRLDDLLLTQWRCTWWLAPPSITPEMVYLLRGYSYLAASTFFGTFPAAPWVWKDPRLTVLLPFWDQILGRQPVLLVHRDPRGVAESISARDGFSSAEALAIWERHTRLVLAALRGKTVAVASHSRLRDDPEQWREDIARFCVWAGLTIATPTASAQAKVLHLASADSNIALSRSQASLYDTVRALEGTHMAFPAVDLPPEDASVGRSIAALWRRTLKGETKTYLAVNP
jgi:hypothetical protein